MPSPPDQVFAPYSRRMDRLGHRLAVRRDPNDAALPRATDRLGLAHSLRVFGLLVGPAGLYIRSHIDETPEFLKAERPQKVSITDLLRGHPVPLLLALG